MTLEIKNENNVWTGVLSGRLDTVAAAQFGEDMKPLIEHAGEQIVLDCERLEYISSTGLRLFLILRKAVEEKGGKLTIYRINDELRNIFSITGFINLFDIRQ